MKIAAPIFACAALFLALPVSAQTTAPATPTPGSAGSTIDGAPSDRTGSTTAVGQTKPPGAPVGDGAGMTPDLERKDREIARKLEKGICSGCD